MNESAFMIGCRTKDRMPRSGGPLHNSSMFIVSFRPVEEEIGIW
jgi:hypothetical protein